MTDNLLKSAQDIFGTSKTALKMLNFFDFWLYGKLHKRRIKRPEKLRGIIQFSAPEASDTAVKTLI